MEKSLATASSEKTIPHFFIIILIIAAGILVYYRSLNGVFLFDDQKLIIENPLIKNFPHIKEIFTTHLFKGSGTYSNFYRPMQSLSFMLDYHLWALKPFGYHLTNVLIHIFSSITVYFLVYLVSKRQGIGFLVGLLFCAHTVLSGPVYYVSARADLLMALFFLISLTSYVLYKETKKYNFLYYLVSLLAFLASLLSKETALVLPFVILLYLYCSFNKRAHLENRRPNLIWVFFIIVAIYGWLRFTVLNFTEGKLLEITTGKIPLYLRLFTTSKVFMIYLRLLVFPVGLHMEWDIAPAVSFLQDEVFLSIVGLLIISGFIYYFYRTSKLKFFAAGWFFITLLPYSNIFPLNYFMGEGWLYIPSIGFFTLVAIYLSELRKRSKIWSLAVIGIAAFAIVFYSVLTIKRADVWKDPVKLYTEVLKYSPNNTKARINLGVVLEKSGMQDKALEKYREAARLNPENASAHINMASLYFNKQMYDNALEELKKAVLLNPKDYVSYNDIGLCYKKKGDIKKAIEWYKKAIELNPNYALTYNNIGNVYLESGRYAPAINSYKKAIELEPGNGIFYANLGKVYKNKGMLKEAKESFEKASRLDPNNKSAEEELKSL